MLPERRARASPTRRSPAASTRPAIAAALAAGELRRRSTCSASTRCATCPTAPPGSARSSTRRTVIAHAAFLTDGDPRARDRRLPARVLRREGGHRHPPRRPRPAAAAGDRPPGRGPRRVVGSSPSSRARLGHETGVRSGAAASAALFEAVPFYGGLELEELAGHGAALAGAPAGRGAARRRPRAARARRAGRGAARAAAAAAPARSARYRSIWAAPEVEASPALHFLIAPPAGRAAPGRRRARSASRHGEACSSPTRPARRSAARVALRDATPAGTRVPRARHRRRAAPTPCRGSSVAIEPSPERRDRRRRRDERAVEEALA